MSGRLKKNIKRLRTVMGLRTQKALVEVLGVPPSRVSDWENNRFAVLEVSNLIKLAKAFHCSVDELLGGVDPDYDRIREGGAVGTAQACGLVRLTSYRTGQVVRCAGADDGDA